ncbi:peptidase C1A, papain family protein [Nitzschia inconspicua]|uniref:Peptidase C1A, papain family protein n=1 Tax=Nitzschia inconspicua TaxID=303405 RepID=A0A9K3PN87_9STRA|nr:peptidase C1A, papain family protein [Nitzschia inconspicua]
MMLSKPLSFFLIIQSASAAVNLRSLQSNADESLATTMMMFRSWADTHDKEYTTEEEAMDRLKIWMENHERMEAHNNQVPKPSFTLGHNEFSDMTNDEFQQRFRLGIYSNTEAQMAKKQAQKLVNSDAASASKMARHLEEINPLDLPEQVNWVALGGVTPVKNQGACGSCWAFSTTGALEGAKFVHTGELVSLSEQNLLDCDHTDMGCSGGLMDNAFKFDEKTGGLCSEEDYPYKAKQGRVCLTNCTDVPGTIVSTFYDVPPGNTQTLMAALSMQPISVAVQANQFVFQFYKTGVLTDDSCGKAGDLDHGVLAAGYGTDSETGEPYFLIKNSWGDKWGENGYIRMSRKSKNQYGMCALLKMASYPEVV